MKKKIVNYVLLISAFFLSLAGIELIGRHYGLNILVNYYASNSYGYYHAPNQKILRRNIKIEFDQYGNRNFKRNSLEDSKIIFLGDSVTYGGTYIDDKDLFTSLIEKLSNKKTLNISANGWGITNIKNFIDYHQVIKSKKIYILVCIEDCFTRNLRKYEQNFMTSGKNRIAILNMLKFFVHSSRQKLFKSISHDTERDNIFVKDKSIREVKEISKKINLLDSKFFVFYSPRIEDIKEKIKYDNFKLNKFLEIKKELENENLTLINIIDKFSENQLLKFRKYFIDNVHLTSEGHDIFSKIILEVIKNDI